jgi:ribosomal protein S18 acetylase RimI-like enzyme
MPPRPVVTTWLELPSRADLLPPAVIPPNLTLAPLPVPSPELNRFFYVHVGHEWSWVDRLPWSRDQWMERLSTPGYQTLVLSVDGVPAGYAELSTAPGGAIEIAYFGLLPQWTGRGLGAAALTLVVLHAWSLGAARILVNTCSLDHPRALDNYRARGFRVVKTREWVKEVPDLPPTPWPDPR